MNKKTLISMAIITVLVFFVMAGALSCGAPAPTPAPPPVPPSYPMKTTLEEASSLIGTTLPVPTYLPAGYEIREVWVQREKEVLLIINGEAITDNSDIPSPDDINGKMRMYVKSRTYIAGGLKIPGMVEELRIGNTAGALQDRGDRYALWWQPDDTTQSGMFEIVLLASKSIPKEELVQVARSVRQ